MAGDMHLPTFRPSCWRDPNEPQYAPAHLAPRARWAWDQAAACGDARSEWHRERQTEHTPECRGCARRIRAIGIENGAIKPHASVITNPQKRAAVSGGRPAAQDAVSRSDIAPLDAA